MDAMGGNRMIIKTFKIDEELLDRALYLAHKTENGNFSEFLRKALLLYCSHVEKELSMKGPRIRILDVIPVKPRKMVVVA